MTNNILLIDIDSVIPNIALMRLLTYYKLKGSIIEFKKLSIPIYKHSKNPIAIDTSEYDRVFVSAIFKGTLNNVRFSNNNNVDIGGTGSDDIKKILPKEVESCKCDYSIYPDADTTVDFISRGCVNDCDFCIVREKEGLLRQVAKISDIVQHKKVKFLDNNFLALPNHLELLEELVNLKLRCQFNQGLDIRLVTDDNANLLSQMNYMGEYTFAFDKLQLKSVIEEKLVILKKYISKPWRIRFFLYCHPKMSIPDDVYIRILWCKENKVLPYFMRDQSCWQSENKQTYNDFSAWCNQPGIFKTHNYERFCRKRRKNKSYPKCCPDWFLNQQETMAASYWNEILERLPTWETWCLEYI